MKLYKILLFAALAFTSTATLAQHRPPPVPNTQAPAQITDFILVNEMYSKKEGVTYFYVHKKTELNFRASYSNGLVDYVRIRSYKQHGITEKSFAIEAPSIASLLNEGSSYHVIGHKKGSQTKMTVQIGKIQKTYILHVLEAME